MTSIETNLSRAFIKISPAPDDAARALEEAILKTVAYADGFDYPLTAEELHRYLIGVSADDMTIHRMVHTGALASQYLSDVDGYFCLRGREDLVGLRLERARIADHLWTLARRYGKIIAGMPYVRMVAVTGSLAVHNPLNNADIDYLVVTAPGRVWLCRAMVILLVRWAAQSGVRLCPNFFLSSDALPDMPRDLYNAHEITQMVPLSGLKIYSKLRRLNAWTLDYLPNAWDAPVETPQIKEVNPNLLRRLVETSLSGNLGAGLENWEMQRKIKRFTRQQPLAPEAEFNTRWCKGHFDSHGQRSLTAYVHRLQSLGLLLESPDQAPAMLR